MKQGSIQNFFRKSVPAGAPKAEGQANQSQQLDHKRTSAETDQLRKSEVKVEESPVVAKKAESSEDEQIVRTRNTRKRKLAQISKVEDESGSDVDLSELSALLDDASFESEAPKKKAPPRRHTVATTKAPTHSSDEQPNTRKSVSGLALQQQKRVAQNKQSLDTIAQMKNSQSSKLANSAPVVAQKEEQLDQED